jgi:hypothetical protein
MFRKIGFQFTVSRREVSSTHSFRIRRKHITQHFEHVQNFSAHGMRMKMAVEPSGALGKLQGKYVLISHAMFPNQKLSIAITFRLF